MVRYTKNNCDFIKKSGEPCGKPCVEQFCRDHKRCKLGGYRIPCSECGVNTHSKYALCVPCEYKLGHFSKLYYQKKKEKKRIQKEIDDKLAEVELLKKQL